MRQAPWIFVLVAAPLLAGAADAQPRDKNWTQCTGDTDNDNVAIAACTAFIGSGHETDANLAIAFKSRCLAYNNKGDHVHAIQDCDQAISLNPGYLDAYLSRGHAHFNRGDFDRAIV